MRSCVVVILEPVSEDDPGLAQCVNQFPVQTFFAETAIEAFHIAILPWTARINVEGFDIVFLEPLLDCCGDELGSVVRADVLRGSMTLDGFLQDIQNIGGLNSPLRMDAVALAGKLINQIEGPQLASALGIVADEVPGPDMILLPRLLGKARGEALTASPGLFRWYLQPFFAPNPLHLLLVHAPGLIPQQLGQPLFQIRTPAPLAG